MKKQAKQELRGKSVEELQKMVDDYRREMLDARVKQVIESERIGVNYRETRRAIARCLTIIAEKQAAGAQA